MSQHLDMPQNAGLIRASRSGRAKIHAIDRMPLRDAVQVWLHRHRQEGYGPHGRS
ncbi:hypothetical protein [Paracoccus lutimaris]|uniref:hypothetical protein n=1 Tax=Paracoccus lutimaris TaxID=1490030 RepID=UPI0015F0D3D9|nr:hypothetical protein [Paracoccus lutimaris]